jgi:hypothetical protein
MSGDDGCYIPLGNHNNFSATNESRRRIGRSIVWSIFACSAEGIQRIKDAFGSRQARDIKARDIDDWLSSLMTTPTTHKRDPRNKPKPPKPMSPASQNRYKGPDVNFETKELPLRETKNGTSRTVQILPTVEKALRALKAMPLKRKRRSKDKPNESPTNSVFGIADSKRWWASVLRRAKVKDFHWHDNRHTFLLAPCTEGCHPKADPGGRRTQDDRP